MDLKASRNVPSPVGKSGPDSDLSDRLGLLEARAEQLSTQTKLAMVLVVTLSLALLAGAGVWIHQLKSEQAAQWAQNRSETAATLDTKSGELNAQIQAAFESIKRLETRVEALQTTGSQLAQRLTGTEIRAEAVLRLQRNFSNHLALVEIDALDIGSQLFQLAEDFKGYAEDGYRKFNDISQTTDNRIAAVAAAGERLGENIAAIRTQVGELSSRVQSAATPLKAWTDRVSELEKLLVETRRRVAELAQRAGNPSGPASPPPQPPSSNP
ncbi:MAG: hypothetical protein FJ405_02370 [Verrucomicrobia bacterium]|nr:hypothetical protein [Verrucomicrobiota bacterium]